MAQTGTVQAIRYDNEFYYYSEPVSPDYISEFRELFFMPDYADPRQYTHVSRYAQTRQIIDKNTKYIYHETYNDRHIPESSQDRFVTVRSQTANRADMIAYEEYQIPQYWWVIAQANNLIDAFNIPVGTTLRIPPISAIYEKGSVLYSGN